MAAAEILDRTHTEVDLSPMTEMLAANDVEGARRFIAELAAKHPNDERVQHYAHVLAPPVAREPAGGNTSPLREAYEWIWQHFREYPCRLLAVRGREVIFQTNDAAELKRFLDAYPDRDQVLVHRRP